jgi:hypothetical protein
VRPAPSRPPEARSWREIEKDASRLLGRRVRFVAQLQGPVEHWTPYLSRFGPRGHAAFQLWADEQWLWLRDEFEAPAVRVFVAHGSAAEAELAAARTYARFEIEGSVRELFLAEPWIEVESVRELPEHISEGSIIHGGRAVELMLAESWSLALSELDQAASGPLPAHAERELERLRQPVAS